MIKWDEFVAWMDGFEKIDTSVIEVDGQTFEAVSFGMDGESVEVVQNALMDGITELAKNHDFKVRVMPEVTAVKDIKGNETGRFGGYVRLAFWPKKQLA